MKKQIKDIIIRMDLYPRQEVDNKKIQEYSENIENLPAIIINQDNILIDGLHRLRGHKQAELKEIEVVVEKTASDNEIYLRAIETNSTHGLQLSYKDKKSAAVKLYDGNNEKRLIKSLSISKTQFYDWTSNKRKQIEEERNDEIIKQYLFCKNQKEIAQDLNLDNSTISKFIANLNEKLIKSDFGNFQPFLYNLWNSSKDNSITHFGMFPQIFIENLLYYYTQPFDIVYDPFAGGGTTIDACKKWMRRYYVADRKPIPAREEEIKKQDIKDGLPNDLPNNIKLVFLDPPYWKQAEGMYSKDKEDLANMALDKFYDTIVTFVKNVKKKLAKDGKIALLIQGSQYKNNLVLEDHSFEIARLMDKLGFKIQQRIICPYSTEQYNAQQVNKAKEKKICLQTYRDLIVYELK